MRFFLTLLCMVAIGTTAAVLVVIDLLLRWLPLVVLAAAIIAAVRISRRRRRSTAQGIAAPPAVLNVPDATAFAAIGDSAARLVPVRGHHRSQPLAPSSARAGAASRRIVVEGTVIGKDGHHG